MGRSANSYEFIGVKISEAEAKILLLEEFKELSGRDWNAELFDILADYGAPHSVRGSKLGVLCAIDWDYKKINALFYGGRVHDVWLGAYSDGYISTKNTPLTKVLNLKDRVMKKFPEKEVKIVTFLNIG